MRTCGAINKIKRDRSGQGLVTVLAICFLMSMIGGGAVFLTQQKEREMAHQALQSEGAASNSSALDFLAGLVSSQTVRGFNTVNPVATYWTVYPANAPVPASSFVFQPGIVPLPPDNATTAIASVSAINDFCNPQSLNASAFGTLMNTMVVPPACDGAGNPAGCCYRTPAGVRFLKAQSGDYLEVLARINGTVLPTVTKQMAAFDDDGQRFSMKARIHIPKLSDMSPPSCLITPQYHHIWWHQYDVSVNMKTFPPPDLPSDTGAFAARLKFPSGLPGGPPDYRPGLINGIDTLTTNPIVFSATATNSGAGYDFIARPNPAPAVPNVTAVYNVPGEADGPGGTGYCSDAITVQQLDKPACALTGPAQIYWRDCPNLTESVTIPPQASPDEAPRPPAYLTSGTVSTAPGTPAGVTVGGPGKTSTPVVLSTASPSNVVNACANMATNGHYFITFNGIARGDAGDGALCQKTIEVLQVPPPTCQFTYAAVEQPPGYSQPVVHLYLQGNSPGVGTSDFNPTSWNISGPSFNQSGSGKDADVYAPLATTGGLTYYGYSTGPSGTNATACQITVNNNAPTCSITSSASTVYVNECATLTLSTAAGAGNAGGKNLFVANSYITSPVNPGNLGWNGGSASFCPGTAVGTYTLSGWAQTYGQAGTSACSGSGGTITVKYRPPPGCNLSWTSNSPINGSAQPMLCDTPLTLDTLTVWSDGSDTGQVDYVDLTINWDNAPPFVASPAWGSIDHSYVLGWRAGTQVSPDTEFWTSGGAAGAAQYVITVHGPGGTKQCNTGAYTTFCQYGAPEYLTGTTMMKHRNDPPHCHWYAYDTKTFSVIADRGCNPGCFAPETMMRMGDGSEKPAVLVQQGDWLWNPKRKMPELVTKVIAGPEKPALVDIRAGKYRVKVSSKHPMITGRGIVRADSLTTRDRILTEDGKWRAVSRVTRPPVNPKQVVYNFDLAGDTDDVDDHALVGDGVVTGDHLIQVRLENGEPLP